jgi:hypothetical protein
MSMRRATLWRAQKMVSRLALAKKKKKQVVAVAKLAYVRDSVVS